MYLTREGGVFRLAFSYNTALVALCQQLPYAAFDGATKTWTTLVCAQSVEGLRRMHYEGLTDTSVDALLGAGEEPARCADAVLRSGTVRRPYLVSTATRNDALYARLRAVPGAQWEKNAKAMSYGPLANAALAELVARGVVSDPEGMLSTAAVMVSFDGRTGRFVVRGDERAQEPFDRMFPGRDIVAAWVAKGLDVAFSDEFSEEIYRGELARVGPGIQPAGMLLPLYPHQCQNVAVAVERSGLGVFDVPGVGKTPAAIGAAVEIMINRGLVHRTVLVVPGAVRTQWAREITRFTGCTDVVVVDGDKKRRHAAYAAAATARWLVVHYDVLALDYKLLSPLVSGAYLIADEAHRCFGAGTMVETRQGPVDIADLVEERRAGVLVRAFDPELGELSWRPVTAWMSSPAPTEMVRITHDHGALTATANHPIWTDEAGWVEAGSLEAGQHLRAADGGRNDASTITAVETVAGAGPAALVYNIEVAGLESYVADGVVVHNCKNPTSKRTKALRQLAGRAARRLALTGTPVENDPGEFFSVLSGFAVPGSLGSPADFFGRYQYPNRWGGYEGARNMGELRVRAACHYVRHTKAEVAAHLPPLRVQHLPVDPDPAYAAALKRAHREARNEIKDAALERAGRARRAKGELQALLDGDDEVETGAEMTAVGQLRMMCSSPRLVAQSTSAAAAAMRAAGIVPDEDGPKLDELRVMVAEMQAAGERLVVFSFSARMADLICTRLGEDSIRYVSYTGGSSHAERDAAVDAFTTPATEEVPGPTVFVATDAAAEGLNLGRCCSTLVNFDIPWTPSRLEQRSNRIHRIDGTAPSYLVINFTVRGTIEEGILRMVESKAELADSIFGEEGGSQRTTGRRGRRASVFEAAMAGYDPDADAGAGTGAVAAPAGGGDEEPPEPDESEFAEAEPLSESAA